MTVTSGRCVPPLNGLFSATTSPGFSVSRAVAQHGAHALAHRAEMHRHVRRVGHQAALGVEDRAGEIQPLLDVDAQRGVLQHRAGLLRHVHEQVVEQFQQHRIGPAAVGGHARRRGLGAAQDHVIERGDLGGPAGLDRPWWRWPRGSAPGRRCGSPARSSVRSNTGARVLCAAGQHANAVDRFGRAVASRPAASPRAPARRRGRLDRDRLRRSAAAPAWRSRSGRGARR